MAANHTGLAITPELLRDAEFTCGESLRTLEGAGAAAGQPRNRPREANPGGVEPVAREPHPQYCLRVILLQGNINGC